MAVAVCQSWLRKLSAATATPLWLRHADPATRLRFVDLAMAIYLAVTEGVLHAGTDADALQALAGAFEAEDGA